MTVVLVPIVSRYGRDAVFLVGIMAGVLIVAAAFARLGRYLAYVPWPVIEGFTVGIAVIIFLQQVPAALGVAKPEGENTALVASEAVGSAFGAGKIAAFGIVLLVAVVMLLAPRVHRSLPGSPSGSRGGHDRRPDRLTSTWPESERCPVRCLSRRSRRISR